MPDPDFSHYELLLLHRLTQLETLAKEQHLAFENLRVDFITHKTTINTRTALIGTIISVIVTAANLFINFV